MASRSISKKFESCNCSLVWCDDTHVTFKKIMHLCFLQQSHISHVTGNFITLQEALTGSLILTLHRDTQREIIDTMKVEN